jgi:hypothetical protein
VFKSEEEGEGDRDLGGIAGSDRKEGSVDDLLELAREQEIFG